MDDANWSEARFNDIQSGLRPFLNKTGYKDSDLVWVPIAGLTGDNLKEKTDKAPWYSGPPLLDILDKIELEKRCPNGPLRIPIIDKMRDNNLIVHGKVENGTINLGDKLALMPSGNLAQVLQLMDGKG
jgi:peptide chain release factor subunit 3